MDEPRGHKPKFVPADQVTTRANDGAPPPWALGIVVATIMAVVIIFMMGRGGDGILYDIVPFAHSTYFWVGLIFLPMVVLITVAVAAKWRDFTRAQSWTTATGKIVRSELVAKHHRFQGEAETVTNAPAVEYEFIAGGRKYLGSRIGIGDDTGGANTEATLARYVLGSDVTVYYDANDPKNCVLERGGPFAHASVSVQATPAAAPAGSGGALYSLIHLVLVGAIVWLIVGGTDYFEQHFPKGDAAVSVFALCFGLASLMLFLAARRSSKAAQGWPSVRGTVVKSEVEEFWDHTGGSRSKSYRAAVEYAYQVHGRNYRGNQIKLDVKVSGSQAGAAKVTAKYPAGGAVDVHYDPANPGRAALENPTGMTWLIFGLAVACFALTTYTLGVFK